LVVRRRDAHADPRSSICRMFDAARIAPETERALWKFADPARALAEKRYLKSDLDHMGASVPQIRGVTRQVVADHPALTRRELLAVVHELWAVGLHERRMAAVFLLEARVGLLNATDLTVIEGLIRDARGWAMVSSAKRLDGCCAKPASRDPTRYSPGSCRGRLGYRASPSAR
jgi:DNA alkylation repair enzyme